MYGHPLFNKLYFDQNTSHTIGWQNTPNQGKEFPLCSNKKKVTLVLPLAFSQTCFSLDAVPHQIQKHCAYPNYDTIPNTRERKKVQFGGPKRYWLCDDYIYTSLSQKVKNMPYHRRFPNKLGTQDANTEKLIRAKSSHLVGWLVGWLLILMKSCVD